MMAYTFCDILNHRVEFAIIPTSGYISVGVDGRLAGNFESDAAAIVAALESVRLAEGQLDRPLLPGRVRNKLREIVGWAEDHGNDMADADLED